MNRTIAATSITAALTMIGAAACSGLGGAPGTGTGTAHGAGSSAGAAVYRQAAACIRAHGVPNFPDWVEDPQTGVWQIPQGTQKPPLRALNACRSYLDQIPKSKSRPAQSSPRPLTTAEVAKARQWAQCIRRHGLPDWPDPKPDGTFELPPRLAQAGKAGFRSQFQACEKYSFGRVRFTAQGNGG